MVRGPHHLCRLASCGLGRLFVLSSLCSPRALHCTADLKRDGHTGFGGFFPALAWFLIVWVLAISMAPGLAGQVTGWSHILGVARMVDLANLTQNHADAARYATYLAELKQTYHAVYFDPTTGVYKGGSQTAQLLPLCEDIRTRHRAPFPPSAACPLSNACLQRRTHSPALPCCRPSDLDITPPAHVPGVVKSLVASVTAKGNTTTAGIVGTAYLMQVLQKHAPMLALAMATSTNEPSLGYMVQIGPGLFALISVWPPPPPPSSPCAAWHAPVRALCDMSDVTVC